MDVPVVDKPGHGRLRRRRNILLAIAALAVIAAVGGLLVSTTIKSPAQQAAETTAPGLTRLAAPVQYTVIRNTVQANGMITKPPQISSLSSGGGEGGVSGGNAQQVVTKIFKAPGKFVAPGNVIIEVAGQPFFVFRGAVPAYRDMAPGESGTDIAQLQAGLGGLGFSVGADTSGVYGRGTAAAVAAFYQSLGYKAPTVQGGPKSARGAEVPLSEIMFVPRFPAQVVKLGGGVGKIVSGSLVTLSMGSPAIKGQLNPAYGSLVRPGMHVTITAQGSPAVVHGTIQSVVKKAQPPIPPVSSSLTIPMPLEAYQAISTQQQEALADASALLIQRCMAARGFEDTSSANPPFSSVVTLAQVETAGAGLTSITQARTFGFVHPKNTGSSSSGPQIIGIVGAVDFGQSLKAGRAYAEALFGFGPGTGTGPGDHLGCMQQASKEVYGPIVGEPVPDPVPQIAAQAASFTQSDPRIHAVDRAWSRCMARHFYHYGTPQQVEHRQWRTPPNKAEIATAVADVTCKTQTNLLNTWLAVEAAYQQALIGQNLTTLSQLQANFAPLLRRANANLAASA